MSADREHEMSVIPDDIVSFDCDIADLRKAVRAYAYRCFVGENYTVKSTGESIEITKKGIKHTTSLGNIDKLKSVFILPSLIENSQKIAVEQDKIGRVDIKAIHKYQSEISDGDKRAWVIIVVRELQNGMKFYDHHLKIKNPPVPPEPL